MSMSTCVVHVSLSITAHSPEICSTVTDNAKSVVIHKMLLQYGTESPNLY